MYTAIRGKVVIKEEFIELVDLINDGNWEIASKKFPFLQTHLNIERGEFIPLAKDVISRELEIDDRWKRKGTIHLPGHYGDWDEDQEYFTNRNNLEWTFIASIKNYPCDITGEQPIDSFLKNVLKIVVDEIISLETWYQEWEKPLKHHKLIGD